MTRKLTRKQKEAIELELLRREIELRFDMDGKQLRNIYHTNKTIFKRVVNWLYWDKSLNVNDILRIFNWSRGIPTYKKIDSALEKRREIHNPYRNSISHLTKCYLLGMRVTDLGCHRGKGTYDFITSTTNYYGCRYFFSVLGKIKHVISYPCLRRNIRGELVLNVYFKVCIPARNFSDVNPYDIHDALRWISNQHVDCVVEFLAACLDCEGSVHENCAYLWNKDIELLEVIRDILKEKLNVNTEIREKERENEKLYYLHINNRKLLSRIMRRLRHPCKELSKKCKSSEGRNMAWKWLLENFPETLTHPH